MFWQGVIKYNRNNKKFVESRSQGIQILLIGVFVGFFSNTRPTSNILIRYSFYNMQNLWPIKVVVLYYRIKFGISEELIIYIIHVSFSIIG